MSVELGIFAQIVDWWHQLHQQHRAADDSDTNNNTTTGFVCAGGGADPLVTRDNGRTEHAEEGEGQTGQVEGQGQGKEGAGKDGQAGLVAGEAATTARARSQAEPVQSISWDEV
jgi:hypothetical protein